MRTLLCGALALTGVAGGTAMAADTHPCAGDAIAKAPALLRLHVTGDEPVLAPEPGPPQPGQDPALLNWSIDEAVTLKPPVQALKGAGQFDVLALNGYVYKATYRMHFLYAQIPEACVLMGQEIIELSDPY